MMRPLHRMTSIRVLLSLVTNLDLEPHQTEVKNAFLKAKSDEEIYMKIPPVVPREKEKREWVS